MNDVWRIVGAVQGRTLFTVTNKAFDVVSVTPDKVVIRVASSGKLRPIPMDEFEGARGLKRKGESLRPVDIRRAGHSEVNPAYVAALLNVVLS